MSLHLPAVIGISYSSSKGIGVVLEEDWREPPPGPSTLMYEPGNQPIVLVLPFNCKQIL